jgi:uncharacterized membrane protein
MLLQAAQTSWFHGVTTVAFVLHIAGGTVALVSGAIAIFARKGGRLHRSAGTVFFISMLVMAALAAYLAVVRPGQMINLFIAAFASYLVVTAWMAARSPSGAAGFGEKIALAVALCLCAPFLLLSVQRALGIPPFFTSAIPLEGPVLVALYGFTSVLVIAALGDAKVVFNGGISGAPRIARHLWRMCLGLTMAAGSAFTNGLPRLLPGPMHVTPIFFLPQFVPLVLMMFWMVRVRLTRWPARQSQPRLPAAAV